ncbi:MAG: hypothetical protein OXH73_03200 [Caldilineaceae bacterium]|nr:hypothetical protein [Caldilineaceae bacterium]
MTFIRLAALAHQRKPRLQIAQNGAVFYAELGCDGTRRLSGQGQFEHQVPPPLPLHLFEIAQFQFCIHFLLW